MEDEPREEREQAELAGREAAAIGGEVAPDSPEEAVDTERDGAADPALRPVIEGGGGEAEGFEQAEELLIEHAEHSDQQSAHTILHDQGAAEEAIPGSAYGEADEEQSSEREDEESPAEQ
jgi:hypothetical protein